MRLVSTATLAFLCIARPGKVPEQCGTPLMKTDAAAEVVKERGIRGRKDCGDCSPDDWSAPAINYLNEHNIYRCIRNVSALEWSPTLECLATKAATLLQKNTSQAHAFVTSNETTAASYFPIKSVENAFESQSKDSVVRQWYDTRQISSLEGYFLRATNPLYTHVGCGSATKTRNGIEYTMFLCYYHTSTTGVPSNARRQSERWTGEPADRSESTCRSLLIPLEQPRDTDKGATGSENGESSPSLSFLGLALGVPILSLLIVIAVFVYYKKKHVKKSEEPGGSEVTHLDRGGVDQSAGNEDLPRDRSMEDSHPKSIGAASDEDTNATSDAVAVTLRSPTSQKASESANLAIVQGSITFNMKSGASPKANNTLTTIPGGARSPTTPSSAKQRAARRPVMTVKDLPRDGLEESLTASAIGECNTIGERSIKKKRRHAAMATEKAKRKKKKRARSTMRSPSSTAIGGLPEVDIPSFVSGGRGKRAKYYTM